MKRGYTQDYRAHSFVLTIPNACVATFHLSSQRQGTITTYFRTGQIYQTDYGLSFAKEINSIPDGGLKIIPLKYGGHLVQVLSRVTTPYTEEIQKRLRLQYSEELAEQNERYILTKKLLYEADPYFK